MVMRATWLGRGGWRCEETDCESMTCTRIGSGEVLHKWDAREEGSGRQDRRATPYQTGDETERCEAQGHARPGEARQARQALVTVKR